MAGDNLITLAQYKAYAGISSTTQDAKINLLIPRISQFVKTYCKRTFVDYVYDNKVEVFNGDSTSLILEETPIISVVSVEYSTDFGQSYTALTKFVDWVPDGDYIKPVNAVSFPYVLLGYRVTYKSGFEDLPEDLLQAVTDLITYYLKNDGSVSSTKFSNTTSMQIEYISDASLPAYIRRILDYYVSDYT